MNDLRKFFVNECLTPNPDGNFQVIISPEQKAQILKNEEDRNFYKELCNGLQLACDKLKEDAEINTRILIQAQNDAVIVARLKKRWNEINVDTDAPEDCLAFALEFQKILGEENETK